MTSENPVVVSTWYDCDGKVDFSSNIYNPSWRHNMIGCFLIEIMKSMYGLNVTYITESISTLQSNRSSDVDLYALPVILSPNLLKSGHPIHVVIRSRYGFLVRRPHDIGLWNQYYTRPFTVVLWKILLLVAVVVCCVFFLTSWWEKRFVGRTVECSIWLEMLLIIGGYCQHIPPLETTFLSRRVACFTFFLYSYIIYTVYTSNLLSHLVSDKEHDIGLDYLENEFFEFAILDNMKHLLRSDNFISDTPLHSKLVESETLPISPALSAVRWNRTALLSDYMSIYPLVQAEFSDAEICELIEVDLNSDVRKYLFASTRFKHREQLKIGTLRVKEVGILKRMTYYDDYHPLACETVLHQEVKIEQIFIPLIILLWTFVISTIIMLLERIHYERTRVWPYVN